MTIKDICERYDLSQTALAKRFDIPLRTVQDWHAGRRTPPDYVISMIIELLEKQGRWEEHVDEYEICATEFTCSVCKETLCSGDMTDDDFRKLMKYCPNCGAKMRIEPNAIK